MHAQRESTSSEVAIWSRVIAPEKSGLSPDAARLVLEEFRFSEADEARMAELAEKCNEGNLTPQERAEYEAYVKVGDVLSLLHLKARRSLNC